MRSFVVGVFMAILLGGCDASPSDPDVIRIELEGGPIVLTSIGETARLAARVSRADGQPLGGIALSWSALDSTVATVSPEGTVTAVRPGSTAVIVRARGATARIDVSVDQRPKSIAIESGDGQRGPLGEALQEPVTVVVRDS